MSPETQESLQTILDCFTGADGGVKFTMFKSRIEDLDQQAQNGDLKAKIIIDVMRRFSKLIDVIGKQ
jgi:hypothetical protein